MADDPQQPTQPPAGAPGAWPPPPPPRPCETAQIRLRIATGFYDRCDVVRETASRILLERALTPKG